MSRTPDASLARLVPRLPPEALHQLIRRRGLDASGELIASATPAQLTALLDLDLWRGARPGQDHRFDADRFGEWLEALVDAGSAVAARTLAGLDPDLVVAGLSRYVRVLDPGIFEPTAQSDDERPDRQEAMREGDSLDPGHDAGDDGPECEVGGYTVRARRSDAWDAVVALLVALDAEHGDCFHAVMQGCRRLSDSRPEIDGLDDLLLAPEQHLHDVADARERRQSQQGYVTPADARAFLEMARRPAPPPSGAPMAASFKANPIVTAYFRAADEPASPAAMALPSAASHPGEADEDAGGAAESFDVVLELLSETGVMPERPRALLEAADADDPQPARLTLLRRLMAYARDTQETAYFTRTRELAFLANALVAGCSVQSRPFTPREAADAAAGICNLGIEYWPERWPGVTSSDVARPDTGPPDSLLIDHDLVTAFAVGWSVVHQDVGAFAAEQLISILAGVDSVDPDTRLELAALRRALAKQRDAGTPWRARGAAEVLAMLDMTVWISVLGLLDECPVLPAALTAFLQGHTRAVSQTQFDFISTAAQIGDVRAFMRKLPGLLSG